MGTLPTIPTTTSQKWSPPVKRAQHQQLLPPKICGLRRPLRLRSRNRVQGAGRPGTRRESKIQHQSQNLNQNLKRKRKKKRNPHQRLPQHQHHHQLKRNLRKKSHQRRRSPMRNRRTYFSSEEFNGVERQFMVITDGSWMTITVRKEHPF